MRCLNVAAITIGLALACAQTMARDDVDRGFSASGPEASARLASVDSTGSTNRVSSSSIRMPPRVTLNRSAADRSASGRLLATNSASSRLPLGAPQSNPAADRQQKSSWLDIKANKPISTVLTGLSIVLGAFLLLAWAVRRRMPKGAARLPDEIIEVLGRATIAAKQSLHLVRVGGKLIVVSVTPAGTETLTEITDPGEVARILAACQQHHAHSSSTAFRQVFEQLGREPAHGFLDQRFDRSRSSLGEHRAA